MKTVKGSNKESSANKGMPAKPAIKKGMGKGVKKLAKASKKNMGY
jgi:hypothetical protein